MIKEQASADIQRRASAAAAALVSTAASGARAGCATLLHIHDEASLRLRSRDAVEEGLGRARSSKVQQHVVRLWLEPGAGVHVPTELDALSNKTARVLATSLLQVLLPVIEDVSAGYTAAAPAAEAPEQWFMHVLVGDGINTNQAAARIVLAYMRQHQPAKLRYFMLTVKCALHQAQLSVTSAVCGRAAALGARNTAALCAGDNALEDAQRLDHSAHRIICATTTRLFKYLIRDYYTDFCASLASLTSRLVVAAGEDDPIARRKWEDLARLYGEGVFPPGLLDALNLGLDRWEHRVFPDDSAASAPAPSAADAPDAGSEVRGRLRKILQRRLLVVDEHPTLSRMFTFRPHVDALLLLVFLGRFGDIFKVSSKQPRPRSKARLQAVGAFFREDTTPQYLKRTALCFQVLDHVERWSESKHRRQRDQDISARDGSLERPQEPLLVRVAKGEVEILVSEDVSRLISLLHLDSDLDVGACVTQLLAAAADLLVRFRAYQVYPFLLYKMCRAFHSGFAVACLEFLRVPKADLDLGCGRPLQKLAWQQGSERDACAFLLSEQVQASLEQLFKGSAASSLPAERAFAQTKLSEAPRLCDVSTAGRNQILGSFVRERAKVLERVAQAEQEFKRAAMLRITSIAWENNPQLKTQLERASSMAAGSNRPQAGQRRATAALRSTATAALRQYVTDNRHALRKECAERKQRAADILRLERVPGPLTECQWAQWIEEHHEEWAAKMRSATANRRARARRLVAAPDLPAPVKRLCPTVSPPPAQLAPWWHLLHRRDGWFAMRMGGGGLMILFLYCHRGVTLCANVTTKFRRGHLLFEGAGVGQWFAEALRPLHELHTDRSVQSVLAAMIDGVSSTRGVRLRLAHCSEVVEPLPKPRRASAAREDIEADAEEGASSDSDAALAFRNEVDALGSDTDSAREVDTDLDSGTELGPAPKRRKNGKQLRQTEDSSNVRLDDDSDGPERIEESELEAELEEELEEEVAVEEEGADLEPEDIPGPAQMWRHPRGTWKVAESAWFYISQTDGWIDIKVWMKTALRKPNPGMGKHFMSKTLRPYVYGEHVKDCPKTIALLRAWSVWRSRWAGWAAAKDSRMREVQRMEAEVEAVVRHHAGSPPTAPLFGSVQAHQQLQDWMPVFSRVCLRRTQPQRQLPAPAHADAWQSSHSCLCALATLLVQSPLSACPVAQLPLSACGKVAQLPWSACPVAFERLPRCLSAIALLRAK